MDVLYRLRRATAAEIHAQLDDAPTYTTVRGLLRILERKGHIRHEQDGVRFVFFPCTSREHAGVSQLQHVLKTFFDGSPTLALAALLGDEREPSAEELRRLETAIARKASRKARSK